MEYFNKSLKTEMLDTKNEYNTRDDAKKSIFEYIELFYNIKRIHSAIGYISPIEFESLNPTR